MSKQRTTYPINAVDELQVAMAMEGHTEAFTLLYRRWHPRLLRHALKLTGDVEEANDVMQEAAMAIARNIHRLHSPNKFGPWAYTIVRNRAANHIKKIQRDRTVKKAIYDNRLINDEPSASEEADTLRELIRTLAMNDQEVLAAYYIDGMSVNEISLCLAIPEGTVKSRLYKARTHLKSTYETMKGKDDE